MIHCQTSCTVIIKLVYFNRLFTRLNSVKWQIMSRYWDTVGLRVWGLYKGLILICLEFCWLLEHLPRTVLSLHFYVLSNFTCLTWPQIYLLGKLNIVTIENWSSRYDFRWRITSFGMRNFNATTCYIQSANRSLWSHVTHLIIL